MTGALRSQIALALLLALPLAAFFLGRPTPLPAADFTFVLPQENSTVDPAIASTVSDQWIVQSLFDPLTRLDPITLEPRPGAASSFEADPSGLVWTFKLDPNGRWSDGVAVRAQDFVYGWRRVLSPETASGFAGLLDCVVGAKEATQGQPLEEVGISATDDLTFVVALRHPVPYFPSLTSHFTFMPARRDLIEAHGHVWTDPSRLVGNGPYTLHLRRIRDRVRLHRNEHHPRGRHAAFGIVDALTVEEQATALNLYLTGAVDWVNSIPPSSLETLRGREDLHLSPVLATNFLRVNVTKAPFDDVRVRRALDRALDRDALCRFVYRGPEQPAHSFVPPALAGYTPAESLAEDAEIARAALASAGFPDGIGFPAFELLYAAGDAQARVAEAIAKRWNDVLGIHVRPAPQEYRVCIDSQKSLRYDVCVANWLGDYPDASNFLEIFRSKAGSNRTGYQSADYDRLLDDAATAPSRTSRLSILRDAEAHLLEHGPIIPICYRGQPNLVRPGVVGFTDNLLDLHPLEDLRWEDLR